VQTRRWVNQSQPQTLVIATFLLYFNVVWVILGSHTNVGAALNSTSAENLARLFVAVGGVAAGYLISNEKRVGYFLGIAVAALPLVADLVIIARYHVNPLDFDLVTLLFQIALLALILHTQSRNYVRLWFK
jgi:hypothetical protein